MKKLNLRSGLMATTTIAGALATTMGVTAVVSTVATLAPSAAEAQDYTSGALSGTVTNASGKPIAGATVTIVSKAQGVTTNVTSDSQGRFHVTSMAAGDYDITANASGYQAYKGTASISVSQEVRYTVAMSAVGETQTVVVKGHRNRQDFNGTTTGLNVDLTTLTAQAPIARSITAVTLLAPGAVQGVPGFGDVSSLGGSSVAENAYYINGLNITNPDTYVGSAKVPFDFYKTVEVKTAGYAAEFGRATGGVINATTKSGTNDFMFAVHGNFAPSAMANTSPSTISTNGLLTKNSDNSVSVESGGALIKDKLFLYGLVQLNDNKDTLGNTTGGVYQVGKDKAPFYGFKGDWYVVPGQHLEFTYFTTKDTTDITDSKLKNGVVGAKIQGGTEKIKNGGDNWVGKYTGKINDWFTLSAEYGINKDSNDATPGNPTAYFAQDLRTATTKGVTTTVSADQPFSSISTDDTERKFYRVDGDIFANAMGRHHIRFGLDHEDLSEGKITQLVGGVPLLYSYRDAGVRVTYEHLGGHVSGKDSAIYLQDSWDITPTLNLQLGVRDDEFQQSNLSNQQYLNFKGNWAPRIGFKWDVLGDRSFNVFGNYGVYYIPPAMNLGFRGHDDYFREYFAYPAGTSANGPTASDPNALPQFQYDPTTGVPTQALGAPLTSLAGSGYASACPTDISAAPGSPKNGANTCLIFGGNVQDPAAAKVAVGTKATYENEVVLGADWRINDLWSLTVTGTYRELKRVSEDTDFTPYLYDYYHCDTVSSAQCDFYSNNSAYYIWNPGKSSQTIVDWYGATVGQKNTITLTGLKFPTPKRTYSAVSFDFKRAFDGKWGLNGSLTLSKSYGNYEGTVKSDAGNGAQEDAGSTQDFDYLGLTDYSTGLLPNHHGIQFKTWGEYAITPDFLIGANVLVLSPMHGSCEGYHPPSDPNAAGYGASSFYCSGQPAPRGTGWKSDWEKNVDLSLRYTMPQAMSAGGKLILRADIFNLFDSHAVLQKYAQHETSGYNKKPALSYQLDGEYLQPTEYQAPRYVRVGFDLSY